MICDYRPWIDAGIRDFKPSEFSPQEDLEAGKMMDVDFVRGLQSLRDLVSSPIIIHKNGGYSYNGHSPGSYHYRGQAADFHIIGITSVREQMRVIFEVSLFKGVGYYPEWTHPGFHVDKRPDFLMWVKKDEDYIYLA